MAVAEFRYRHEAEFAAGFLRDAGIPYRLQGSDAGGVEFGLSGTQPAVLWVLAMDADRARELITVEEALATDPAPARPASPPTRRSEARLSGAERSVAGVLAIGVGLLGASLQSGPFGPVAAGLCGIAALVLAAAAVLGRTPAPVRSLLRALSGEAP